MHAMQKKERSRNLFRASGMSRYGLGRGVFNGITLKLEVPKIGGLVVIQRSLRRIKYKKKNIEEEQEESGAR
jgi:hypothetical protein